MTSLVTPPASRPRSIGVSEVPTRHKDASSPCPLLVAGAGPAGLTAAHEAVRHGIIPLVIEQGDRVGGIARTEDHRGYRFDIGGHRFYTKVPEVQKLWEETLGSEFRLTPRLSRIFYNGKFYQYPLNIWETLRNLGVQHSAAAILSYGLARMRPRGQEETFEAWVTNRFGKCLFETFFKTYTEKVWGMSCKEIRAEWAAQRIQDLSFLTAVKKALLPGGGSGPKSLIEQFHYPRLGPGMMWERMADRITERGGSVRTGTEVVRIHHRQGRVHSAVLLGPNGPQTVQTERMISSMALDDLILRMDPPPPPHVVQAARSLRYRDFLVVGLAINQPSSFADNWIYVHTATVQVGRIQNFGNWSADMVPDSGKSSVGMEYFCNRGDRTWNLSDDALVKLASDEASQLGLLRLSDVRWGKVIRQPKAYPVYDETYRAHLEVIREWLSTLGNFQTIGRNGMHRYNNQDHSMLTGTAAVRRFLGCSDDPWSVNTERSYYEEQRVASDPRMPFPSRPLTATA
ncbi:MAG: NAD(P)/FAD-dependent oxidoreductase [Verrucomicrobiota bacterium]